MAADRTRTRAAVSCGPMRRETELDSIERLLAMHERGTTALAPDESTIPVDAYLSAERFEAERRTLFRATPISSPTRRRSRRREIS